MTAHPIGSLRCGSSELRALFPALRDKTYLSICDKTILADPVRQQIDVFLDHLANASANRVGHEEKVNSSRQKFARLVGASPAEIAVTRNVSDGINSIATAFDFAEGANVVVALNAEHPNNIYPWLNLRRRGIELHNVAAADGRIDVQQVVSACNEKTQLVSVASTTFAPGDSTDLEALGAECGKRDIFLLVDGVQTAGIRHHDFSRLPIDGFATSTSKGLLGLYGYGFLYVREKWLDRLTPIHMSRTGAAADNDNASAMGSLDFSPRDDAGRFELGSYNLAGAYAADASLDLLLSLGTEAIEAHVLSLARSLREGVTELGINVFLPKSTSHLITIGALDAGGHGKSDESWINSAYDTLSSAGIVSTIRRGQLRFGLHAYNNASDIDHVLELLSSMPKR